MLYATIFSAPETKAHVHYCDHALSVVRPSSLTFHIVDFSSKTAERNSTKHDRKQDLIVLYQACVFPGWSEKQDGRPGRSVKKVAHCTQVHDIRHFWAPYFIKVCRQSRRTFLLLYCLFFLVYFSFISFPLSAFCDFSAICHRISLIFSQLVDNNL